MAKTLRIPHCSHWGACTILVQNGKIVGVEPFAQDAAPSPILQSIADWAKESRRVMQPLVREGWLKHRHNSDRTARGKDTYIPLSWDHVLPLIREEVERVRSSHGNQSIFAGSYGWTSCGRFHHAATLLKRLFNLVGGFTGHSDTYSLAAGQVILKHVLGSDDACSGRATTLGNIAEHSETLVVFGALSPRTGQCEAGGIASHNVENYLQRMASRNVQIYLVSPRRDDLPLWLKVKWLPIRPNADTALMTGLAGEILANDAHDAAFLQQYCSGIDVYLNYLNGRKDGIVKNAAWASEITGLPIDEIKDLARRLVSTRSMITVSWSLQRAHHGEQPYWAALGLASMIGQIGLPGGGVGYGYASTGAVGDGIGLIRSPAMSQGKKALDSFIPVSRIADMLLNPGESFTYNGEERQYPDTRLVYWAGGNPFHHHQDLKRFEKAWARPETIIVQDPMFTATAQRADIILPASTSLERNDLAGNKRTEFIFAMHKAIDPLGAAKSDFEIFSLLAEQFGVAEQFTEGRSELEWVRHLYELSKADAKSKLDVDLSDFEVFWERGYEQIPLVRDYTYLEDFRKDPDTNRLETESGRIVLGSSLLKSLDYADCPEHPAWLEPAEWLGSAETPLQLHLLTPQPAGRLHSQLEDAAASLAHKQNGLETALLNEADAARIGINSGDTIRLYNDRGACLASVTVTSLLRPGVVVLPTGAWYKLDAQGGLEISGNPNVLTLDIPTSQYAQGCSAHTCLVKIEAAH